MAGAATTLRSPVSASAWRGPLTRGRGRRAATIKRCPLQPVVGRTTTTLRSPAWRGPLTRGRGRRAATIERCRLQPVMKGKGAPHSRP